MDEHVRKEKETFIYQWVAADSDYQYVYDRGYLFFFHFFKLENRTTGEIYFPNSSIKAQETVKELIKNLSQEIPGSLEISFRGPLEFLPPNIQWLNVESSQGQQLAYFLLCLSHPVKDQITRFCFKGSDQCCLVYFDGEKFSSFLFDYYRTEGLYSGVPKVQKYQLGLQPDWFRNNLANFINYSPPYVEQAGKEIATHFLSSSSGEGGKEVVKSSTQFVNREMEEELSYYLPTLRKNSFTFLEKKFERKLYLDVVGFYWYSDDRLVFDQERKPDDQIPYFSIKSSQGKGISEYDVYLSYFDGFDFTIFHFRKFKKSKSEKLISRWRIPVTDPEFKPDNQFLVREKMKEVLFSHSPFFREYREQYNYRNFPFIFILEHYPNLCGHHTNYTKYLDVQEAFSYYNVYYVSKQDFRTFVQEKVIFPSEPDKSIPLYEPPSSLSSWNQLGKELELGPKEKPKYPEKPFNKDTIYVEREKNNIQVKLWINDSSNYLFEVIFIYDRGTLFIFIVEEASGKTQVDLRREIGVNQVIPLIRKEIRALRERFVNLVFEFRNISLEHHLSEYHLPELEELENETDLSVSYLSSYISSPLPPPGPYQWLTTDQKEIRLGTQLIFIISCYEHLITNLILDFEGYLGGFKFVMDENGKIGISFDPSNNSYGTGDVVFRIYFDGQQIHFLTFLNLVHNDPLAEDYNYDGRYRRLYDMVAWKAPLTDVKAYHYPTVEEYCQKSLLERILKLFEFNPEGERFVRFVQEEGTELFKRKYFISERSVFEFSDLQDMIISSPRINQFYPYSYPSSEENVSGYISYVRIFPTSQLVRKNKYIMDLAQEDKEILSQDHTILLVFYFKKKMIFLDISKNSNEYVLNLKNLKDVQETKDPIEMILRCQKQLYDLLEAFDPLRTKEYDYRYATNIMYFDLVSKLNTDSLVWFLFNEVSEIRELYYLNSSTSHCQVSYTYPGTSIWKKEPEIAESERMELANDY